jgi:nucleotide-binding universal stress UspA family protein
MMNKKRILVAADLTNGRDAAFERGLEIARMSGAEVYLLHAVPAKQPFSSGATKRLRRTAEFRDRAERLGVTLQAVDQHGDPAEIIELHANARDVDLIVMGAEPHRKPKWLRRSSLTERVLRRSKQPTLVVPSADDASSDFENVLVAVDLSPESRTLVEHATQLAGGNSPRLTVVHAVESIEAADAVQTHARWIVPEYRTHLLDDARRELESVLHDVRTPADTRVQLATGSAPAAIVDEARAIDADLIVVGKSDRFRPLGRTAVRVLRDQERALLVVPATNGVRARVERGEYQRAA